MVQGLICCRDGHDAGLVGLACCEGRHTTRQRGRIHVRKATQQEPRRALCAENHTVGRRHQGESGMGGSLTCVFAELLLGGGESTASAVRKTTQQGLRRRCCVGKHPAGARPRLLCGTAPRKRADSPIGCGWLSSWDSLPPVGQPPTRGTASHPWDDLPLLPYAPDTNVVPDLGCSLNLVPRPAKPQVDSLHFPDLRKHKIYTKCSEQGRFPSNMVVLQTSVPTTSWVSRGVVDPPNHKIEHRCRLV